MRIEGAIAAAACLLGMAVGEGILWLVRLMLAAVE